MKKVFLFLMVMLSFFTIKAQQDSTLLIMFNYQNIDDIIHRQGEYFLEYNDPDVFDLETLAYMSKIDKWPTNYVKVTISTNLLDQFISDWNEWQYLHSDANIQRMRSLEFKWAIKEYWEDNQILFKLVRVQGNWYMEEPKIVEE